MYNTLFSKFNFGERIIFLVFIRENETGLFSDSLDPPAPASQISQSWYSIVLFSKLWGQVSGSGAGMETCLSGRKGHPAKVLTAQAVQEFESPRLRQMADDR